MTYRIPRNANPVQQHRKAMGKWEQRTQQVTKKSMRKAIRKARNVSESTRTICAKEISTAASTALKAMIIVGIFSTYITPAEAMKNGLRNNDAKAETVFPYFGSRSSIFRNAKCSGTRLNSRYLISARHCFENGRTTAWVYNRGDWIGNYIWAKKVTVHPNKDVAIVELDTPAQGNIPCIPMMNAETLRNLERSQPDINGKHTGRYVINGVGSGSSEEGRLFAGYYDYSASDELRGVKHTNNPTPCVLSGDSGSGLLGINPRTGNWEFRGVIVDRNENAHFGKGCTLESNVHVDTTNPEMQQWILEQMGSEGFCTPTENNKVKVANLVPEAKESNFDPCKAPTDIYDSIKNLDICACYDKKVVHAPEKYNCPPSVTKPSATNLEHTRGAIQCLDIETTFNSPYLNYTVKNKCNEEFLSIIFHGMDGKYFRFHNFAAGKSFTGSILTQISKEAGLAVTHANGYKEFYPNYFEYIKPAPFTEPPSLTTTKVPTVVTTIKSPTTTLTPTTTVPTEAPTTKPITTTSAPTSVTSTTDQTTKATTEQTTKATTEQTTKATTEQTTKATTEQTTKPTTEPTIISTPIAKSEITTPRQEKPSTKRDLSIGLAAAALATGIGIAVCSKKRRFRAELNFEPVQTGDSNGVELTSVTIRESFEMQQLNRC